MSQVTIHIEGKPYQAKEGESLLRACLCLGFDVPYFCWHPALDSVGACRQCAVKLFRDEKDETGKIVMSCMTPVAENMRVSVGDPEVQKFRARNIEWLMLNHPHDCPVCDEGGECHLQDMTVMTGHTYRRTRFPKRTYRNQYLGPFINHEMNRCIQCYRCVRFYRDYAAGRDFDVFGSRDRVYFGRHKDGILENPFSGNLVEICPTGVLTDKTEKRHFTRLWDLQTAPSVCVHCGLGCNAIPGERYGELRRTRNRYNGHVNGYFLCDRGRFGYEFVNSTERVREPLLKEGKGGTLRPAARDDVLARLKEAVAKSRGVIGIGSPRASLEANFALLSLVGPERFHGGVSQNEAAIVSRIVEILKKGPARTPSLAEMTACDAVFILGEDLANTAPVMALNILQAIRNKPMEIVEKLRIPICDDRAKREAVQDRHGPLFIASSSDTWLDSAATKTFRAAPGDLARLAFAVAARIDTRSPLVPDLEQGTVDSAFEIAEALKTAVRPLIICGASSGREEMVEAAANVAWALCKTCQGAEISFVLPECNSLGLALMSDKALDEALAVVERGDADTMIILENDLFRRAEKERVRKCLEKCDQVILVDHLLHETSYYADVVLSAATFAEETGTLVNNEGRAQRYFQVFHPATELRPAWQWLRDIMDLTGRGEGASWENLDDCIAGFAERFPDLEGVRHAAPLSGFRITGRKVPRQSPRASGRTSVSANIDVNEPKPADDPDSPLSFSMEGHEGEPPAPLMGRFQAPGWNSVQAVNKFQSEVDGALHGGDPGIRLVEPKTSAVADYYGSIPEPFEAEQSYLAVPFYHIFGSDETSMLSPSIAERVPKAYIALNPAEAAGLQVSHGEVVVVSLAGSQWRLPVTLKTELPAGTAGFPAGFPEVKGIAAGHRLEIRKVVL
jgi:NADH-quinone oxidoreductase subunit G